jgi:hypothetical protein
VLTSTAPCSTSGSTSICRQQRGAHRSLARVPELELGLSWQQLFVAPLRGDDLRLQRSGRAHVDRDRQFDDGLRV